MDQRGNIIKRLLVPVRDGRLFYWVAATAAKRWVGALLALYAFATDAVISSNNMTFTTLGLSDEVAHLATALVILGALVRIRRSVPDQRFGWAMLTWAMLIDVDHLPLEFGSSLLTNGTPRPYTHALWTVIALTAAWAIARLPAVRSGRPRPTAAELILAGTAWGLAVHFARDLPTGPMSFWWPVSSMPVQVPCWWYVAALAVIIAAGPVRRSQSAAEGARDTASGIASPATDSDRTEGTHRHR